MSCASGEVRLEVVSHVEEMGGLCSVGSFVEASEFSCFFCDYFVELFD